ncbi:MAG: hypothetical protein H6707_18215 [Deltaproteobacteria bacterium]|nr:hypothetical protein [Deltaproteobacteria bacterium]
MMSSQIWIAIGAVIVVGALLFRGGSALARALRAYSREGQLAPLVDALEALPEQRRLTEYDRAITTLWRDYQREAAARLVSALVERHGDTRIAQYWLQEVRAVEPEIFASEIGAEFYQTHHNPQVAADCGKFG